MLNKFKLFPVITLLLIIFCLTDVCAQKVETYNYGTSAFSWVEMEIIDGCLDYDFDKGTFDLTLCVTEDLINYQELTIEVIYQDNEVKVLTTSIDPNVEPCLSNLNVKSLKYGKYIIQISSNGNYVCENMFKIGS